MTLLLTSLFLSSLALALSYLLGKNNPGRTSVLTSGSIVVLLLLPLTLLLPKVDIHSPQLLAPLTTSTETPSFHWASITLFIWLAGSTILGIRLLMHCLSVRRWRRHSLRCSSPEWTSRLHQCCAMLDMDTIPSLGLSNEISSPVVTGLIYPQILLPESSRQWADETINHVLLHELGHVKRRDLWISVASHIACAMHWFNPLVWILRKRQVTQCEFACDSFVLSSGANANSYIHAICDVAESASDKHHVALALAMANKASLKQRVKLLLEEPQPTQNKLIFLILLLSGTTSLAVNMVQPIAPQIPPEQEPSHYSKQELQKRHHADPFPAD